MLEHINDRNFYRMLDDEELIAEGRASKDELAFVLAERLKDTIRKIDGYLYNEEDARRY